MSKPQSARRPVKQTDDDEITSILDGFRSTEHKGKIPVFVQDITLDNIDRMTTLVRKGGAGEAVALTWIYLHQHDPRITLEHVRGLRQGDIDIVRGGDEDAEPAGEVSDDEVFTDAPSSDSPTG